MMGHMRGKSGDGADATDGQKSKRERERERERAASAKWKE